MYLKKLNMEDSKKEYEYYQSFQSEDGFENEWYGISYDEFVNKVLPLDFDNEKGINLKEGYVPDCTYLLYDDENNIVGEYHLRLCLNDFLRNGPGHIGYIILKQYRQKGYAKTGLKLLVELIKKNNLVPEDELYFEANNDNIGSVKTVLACGGYIHHKTDKFTYTRIKIK